MASESTKKYIKKNIETDLCILFSVKMVLRIFFVLVSAIFFVTLSIFIIHEEICIILFILFDHLF